MTKRDLSPGATVTTTEGETVEYAASWACYPLLGPDGEADATISATTYLASPAARIRPVTFLFNGGPGASSSPLHMQAVGPRILTAGPDGRRVIAANPHTLLDRSDLVFVDPVGTGFNRKLRPGGEASYLTVHGDAASVEHLIRQWLAKHERSDSPVYLVGESYGAFRLATMCASIADLPVGGLVLISPMLNASASARAAGNDLLHVFALPTMAVAAWAHGRASYTGQDAGSVFDAALAFAQDDYLRALHRGFLLDDAERRRVAGRLAELIGVPVGQVLDADLRLDSEDFQRTLLADRGELLGRLDTRVSGPMPPPETGWPLAADDPALGLGRATVKHSHEIASYLTEQAGAPADGPYVSLSLEVAFGFDYRSADTRPRFDPPAHFYRNPTTNIAKLLRERPDTRVLVLGGYFDLATPLLAGIYAVTHAGLPRERVEVLPLEAGHSLEPAVLPAVATALRRFVALSGCHSGTSVPSPIARARPTACWAA